MQALQEICQVLARQPAGHKAALATIVKTSGSTYRRAGARMLMTERGGRVGSISGGCLEADVIERAQSVLHSGQPLLVTYDTTSEGDIIWGHGLGCNGVVEVLIECVDSQGPRVQVQFLADCLQQRRYGILATVFRVAGRVAARAGACLMMTGQTERVHFTDMEDAELTARLTEDAKEALLTRRSQVKTYELSAGAVEVFIEFIKPPQPLVICGAGDDAIPVVRLAKALSWHVTVADHRTAYATQQRFDGADEIIMARPECLSDYLTLSPDTAVVIMTHNYRHDFELLRWLLPTDVNYIGVLGSKQRTARLLKEASTAGQRLTPADQARLHAPVGLDIGAESPEEIALSIIAEIQAVKQARAGGLLRDLQGAIHQCSTDVHIKHYSSVQLTCSLS